jgi:ABC-2 type transport system ATP-binding protein
VGRRLKLSWSRRVKFGLEAAIRTAGLTKRFGDLVAVDQVNFEVGLGEVFGFLGPNGAGKTTTIRMLVGLTTPSEGTAIVNGLDIRRETVEVKRHVGVVPEASNLYDELTAWENLLFASRLYNVPKQQRGKRIEGLLKDFGLWDRRDAKFGRLSKGLKRRLTLAASLTHQPDIVFLDEPTTGLDVMSARSFRRLIEELREKGVTIFLTTHYIEEADQLCNRIAIIVKGRIIAVDTPEDIKSIIKVAPVVEVSFDPPPDSKMVGELEATGEVAVEGCKVRILTKDVLGTVTASTKLAARYGLRIDDVNTMRPSLEDAFVRLTGISSEAMRMEKELDRK